MTAIFSLNRRDLLRTSAVAASSIALDALTGLAAAQDDEGRFQLSLHQYSLKKLFDAGELDLLSYPKFAKETLGVSNIEFGAEFCTQLLEDPRAAVAIRRAAEDIGVRNRVLLCADGKALDAAKASERDEALEEHIRWAAIAERLGCEFIRVRASSEGDQQTQWQRASDGIGALCRSLEASPVSVLVENIAGLSRNASWLVELVRRIGIKRVGLLADFGNFDGDLYDGMRQMLPYTKSICTKSWAFDAAGRETTIDFERMMKVIKESKFRGCIAVEYLGDDPVKGIRQTIDLVKANS